MKQNYKSLVKRTELTRSLLSIQSRIGKRKLREVGYFEGIEGLKVNLLS